MSISVSKVVKKFGGTTAVDAVTFDVKPGELFGLIGPDGAGKTTLIRILVTLLVPDGGSATVLGRDVVRDMWALRRRVGYMAGRFALYPDLSVEENLRFFASVFGTTVEAQHARIAPIYNQLAPFKERRAGALSGGMKQKLALCCALVHKPDVLFLDEPTTGVDAVSRREFWDLLGELTREGLTTLVSTPYMDEATRCDRVGLIQNGRLLAVDTPDGIVASFSRPLFGVTASPRYEALKAIRAYEHTHSVYPFGEMLHYTDRRQESGDRSQETGVRSQETGVRSQELAAFLKARGLTEVSVAPIKPTIEDSFIAHMDLPAEAGSYAS